LAQRGRVEREYPYQIGPHHPPMDQPVQGHRVTHGVAYQRPPVPGLKRVLVNPQPIGTAQLFIHEAVRRFPGIDPRSLAQRDAMQAQPLVDERCLAHHDGQRSHHAKA
jgi:hypothetical protein